MQISQFFVNGDIKGAIAYMRDHEEFKDILPAYVTIFEDQKYCTYEIPDSLNDILRLYQIYFRDTLRMQQYIGILAAVAAYYLVYERAYLLCALLIGVYKIQFACNNKICYTRKKR